MGLAASCVASERAFVRLRRQCTPPTYRPYGTAGRPGRQPRSREQRAPATARAVPLIPEGLLQGGGVRARECIEPTTIFFSPQKKIPQKKKKKKKKKKKNALVG